MSDPQEPSKTTPDAPDALSKFARPPRADLRSKTEPGQTVKQQMSHGRTKAVPVEVRKKRPTAAGPTPSAPVVQRATAQPTLPPRKPVTAPAAQPTQGAQSPQAGLTLREKQARIAAIEAAAIEDARRKVDLAAEEARRKQLEDERRKLDAAAPPPSVAEARRPTPVAPPRIDTTTMADRAGKRASQLVQEPEEREDIERRPGKPRTASVPAKAPKPIKGDDTRRRAKLTVAAATSEDALERTRSVAAFRRRIEKERRAKAAEPAAPSAKVVREVVIPEAITVGELANRMAERANEVIKALMKNGVMAMINQTIDADTAELIVAEFGHRAKRVAAADVEKVMRIVPDAGDRGARARPPVVTIMGHVDHGKTSLLDALRQTDVAAHEAGGITQHIGAYQVETKAGRRITFLDTPGHEAFTAMRKRGAQVTDIVILVVAADDGVQPQTVEAINHARAARVPMIIAINKVDKPDANPTRVKNDLLKYEVVTEEMGGDTQVVEVSALKRTGLEDLERAIVVQAEVLDLKANPDVAASGAVIEAKLDRGRGPVATVLVQRGTLKVGDIFVAGAEWGRVRAMYDHHGRTVAAAAPAMPVEVVGLSGTPLAGDDFAVVPSEAKAREVTEFRQSQIRTKRATAGARSTLEQMFSQIKEGVAAEVPVVIKADVQGSAEAIASALERLGTEEVRVRVMHAAVGGITESDVSLAGASHGLVIGFNVRANPPARDLAKRDAVEVRYYSIIYDIVEDVKSMMSGKLKPSVSEQVLGQAAVREVFQISKIGKIAGCMVTQGLIRRGGKVRLLRDNVVIHTGALGSLKRFKEDAKEVREGFECGIGIDNFNDIHQGDVIECFEVTSTERTL